MIFGMRGPTGYSEAGQAPPAREDRGVDSRGDRAQHPARLRAWSFFLRRIALPLAVVICVF